ncbi:MAG: hypothetical protein MJ142_01335 [Clostridia bacterium]|nr:hypothetical protein [Clostridia bacterium]
MKKIICAVLALVLALSCVSVFAEEAPFLAGGWMSPEDTAVTADARKAFDKAFEDFTGVSYEPVALLGTQVVAGLNYCLLCKATMVTPEQDTFYALVYIYAALDGSAELLDVQTLNIGVSPLADEEEAAGQNPAMNIIGFYSDKTSQRATMNIAALGDDQADVIIMWANSALETVEWLFRGTVDPDTLTVTYTGCEKRICTYDEAGNETVTSVYTDGEGTLTFAEDGSVLWNDSKENAGADCVFVWDYIAE